MLPLPHHGVRTDDTRTGCMPATPRVTPSVLV